MAFCGVEFFGESIEKMSGMNVLLPAGEGPWPVLYLLHGLSDNHTAWCRRTSIERYVADLPLIVVMPDGHRSFYCNDPRPDGCAYEDHIVKDVVGFVDRMFPTIPHRGSRAVAGLSMGGYGAVMLALRHPDDFCVACSHSGAVGFIHERHTGRDDVDAMIRNLSQGEYDCFALAERLAAEAPRIALRLDCGRDDFLLRSNRQFHAHLSALGVPHEYEEHDGDHNWEYWDAHITATLEFVMRHVGRDPSSASNRSLSATPPAAENPPDRPSE
jgi:putative tributyrin esterase